MEGLPDAVQVGGSEGFGVQHQAWCGRKMLVGIEFVAEDRVADGGEMDAQLVAASGVRGEGNAAGRAVAGEDFVAGVRRLAVFVADFLSRAALPVGDERVFDVAAVVGDVAVDDGDVALFHAARGKFLFVVALGGFVFGDEQEAAGCHVEAVRGHCRRSGYLATALHAVVFVVAAAGDGEQSGGFVDDVDVRVFVVDVEIHAASQLGVAGFAWCGTVFLGMGRMSLFRGGSGFRRRGAIGRGDVNLHDGLGVFVLVIEVNAADFFLLP